MNNQNEIYIYGSGGLGRGVLDLIYTINRKNGERWKMKGFLDDTNKGNVNGYEVVGNIDSLLNMEKPVNVVLAFGNPRIKRILFEKLKYKDNIKFPNLIHPNVDVSPFNCFGQGNIISYGVALSTNINIKNFNLIHYNCSIGHDVVMGNFNSVFPLTALSGYVELGDEVEIGTNASIIPSKNIGSKTKIGAGSVVINSVPEGKKIVGVPGREI
ncbi:NeuD/PglB/VioB family sugar acetyltransferase [Halobacillus sp. Marseille-Q1614]|uniref:NeuD/PglB/VioB family sugar acetyltransferase n=1 Tax=Halobacillus sp. Marseille-Q1614 TaxID=2709134 RepID=UPI00156E8007|nr:NeuD/PglB/VioB family sugar acetyltransferase [Halobacillus sp. Marseille-Q1614]